MRFSYTEVGPGVHRPLVPVVLSGPANRIWVDGLLDTGADRTLIPLQWIDRLGIDPATLPASPAMRSATGHPVSGRIAFLALELTDGSTAIGWMAEVIVASDVSRAAWGYRGFLEYFHATFDGPNRIITLSPDANVPPWPAAIG